MENCFKNKFFEINLDRNSKYAEIIFYKTTSEMSKEEYKSSILEEMNFFISYNTFFTLYLSDLRDLLFVITTDLQKWSAKHAADFHYPENMKYAIVLGTDIFTAVSVKQTSEELAAASNKIFDVKNFDDISEAKKWLFFLIRVKNLSDSKKI